ncbi:MAG: hypothetical protein AAFU79_27750 [Myxococcota bacterium]
MVAVVSRMGLMRAAPASAAASKTGTPSLRLTSLEFGAQLKLRKSDSSLGRLEGPDDRGPAGKEPAEAAAEDQKDEIRSTLTTARRRRLPPLRMRWLGGPKAGHRTAHFFVPAVTPTVALCVGQCAYLGKMVQVCVLASALDAKRPILPP